MQLHQRVADGRRGHPFVELAQLLAPLLVGLRQALQDRSQLLLQRRDLVLDVPAHGLGQGIEDVGLDHLALVHGRHGEAGGGTQQSDVLRLRLLAQRVQGLLVAGSELLVDGAPARLVVLPLEARRQHAAQLVERRDHAAGEVARTPVREPHRLRAVGVLEVVDVHPVGRRGRLRRLGPEVRLDRRGLARGRRPEHEHVVVVALDAGAELNGLERPLLADQPGDRDQLVGRLEAEGGRIDHPAQLGGLQRLRPCGDRGHLALGSDGYPVAAAGLRAFEKHAISALDAVATLDNGGPDPSASACPLAPILPQTFGSAEMGGTS